MILLRFALFMIRYRRIYYFCKENKRAGLFEKGAGLFEKGLRWQQE